MIYQHKKTILQGYCNGEIHWRDAASSLGISGFDAFEAVLKEMRMPLYVPDRTISESYMQQIDAWMDDGLEDSHE